MDIGGAGIDVGIGADADSVAAAPASDSRASGGEAGRRILLGSGVGIGGGLVSMISWIITVSSGAIGAMSRFPSNGEMGPEFDLNTRFVHSALSPATFKGIITSMSLDSSALVFPRFPGLRRCDITWRTVMSVRAAL